MSYDMSDVKQAAIGGFSAVLFFFAIRQGEPLSIEPLIGGIIGGIWLLLLFTSNNKNPGEHRIHFIGNLMIIVLITGALTLAFKMGALSDLLSWAYFGSAAWIAVWIAMPVALLFDLNNFTNVLSRYYAHKRKK
jgi:hypothetical protein